MGSYKPQSQHFYQLVKVNLVLCVSLFRDTLFINILLLIH